MTEYAGVGLRALFTMIDAAMPIAVNSGVVGNAAHTSGYHRSRNRLLELGKRDDYSIQAADDKAGPGDACCGQDVSWPLAQMKLITQRVVDACKANDPRVYALREIIGTIDGTNVCGYNRVASGMGTRSKIGFVASGFGDSSHLWHNHFSVLRKYADDVEACKAIAAVVLGLPLPPVVVPKIIINGKEYDDLTSVSVAGVNLARDTGVFSRHVYYVQLWLDTVLPDDFTTPPALAGRWGYWDAGTQEAVNAFRKSLGWSGADIVGSVGLSSLDILAGKASSTKPVRP